MHERGPQPQLPLRPREERPAHRRGSRPAQRGHQVPECPPAAHLQVHPGPGRLHHHRLPAGERRHTGLVAGVACQYHQEPGGARAVAAGEVVPEDTADREAVILQIAGKLPEDLCQEHRVFTEPLTASDIVPELPQVLRQQK